MRRLLLASLGVAVVVAAGCTRTAEPPITHVPSVADSAEQVMAQFSSILTHRGVERGTMTADTAFVFDDQTRFDFRNIHVNFSDSTGAHNGTMRADSGRYNMRTEVLEGWGNVVITTTNGERLETPQLRYNQATNLVSSDTSFVLTQGSRVQRGIGFTTDPGLNRIQILRKASGSGVISSFPDH
ncbi:MAG: LPS export ABC transporter periplasmic protein LptC [Gemmatimonadota bacterium]|nr:LPS export ABC transporter periplasmic protein LptC [Gemmatimonadota bacterium]